MTKDTYHVRTDSYCFSFRVNLSEASSAIELLGDDGEWLPTQYQTASVCHCKWIASRFLADDIDSAGGFDLQSQVLEVR